ncbi:MAG: adenosine deaminase [Ilumatobacteraceae bacterium]
MSPLDAAAVAALPKVELHCHLEGTMRATTAAELARRHGIAFPVEDPAELYRYEDLTGFLGVFWLIQSVLGDGDAWERLAYESVVDAAAHGLVHREAFFTPARHLGAGQQLATIVQALDAGLRTAEAETGVSTSLIFDIDRDFGPQIALEHVEQLCALRRAEAPGSERVIGIGMDSTELGVDPATYRRAYAAAAMAGLRRTAHQGENSPASAIATAVDVLGCERIDHGISVLGDPELTRRLADERMPLTVCPNANVRINPGVVPTIAEHPFPRMRDAGLLVTLNTDDPGLVGLDLTAEYLLSATAFGYGWDDLVAIALAGVEASWLDAGDKAALQRRVVAGAAAAAAAT